MNFHYLFAVSGSVKLYPLFGLTLSNWMFDGYDLDLDWDGDHLHFDDGGNHNECRFGVNLGAGAELTLPRNWAMNFEFRYQLVSNFGSRGHKHWSSIQDFKEQFENWTHY